MKLEGAVAVVIGGANGMGKCYCESLLRNGTKVLLCDIQVQTGEETVNELSHAFAPDTIVFRKCNGVNEDDVKASLLDAKARWGRLDIIVNHVGILDEGNWKRMLEINLGSAVVSAKVTEEILGKNNGGPGGILIHTSSRAGVVPSHLLPIYSASKAAMIQYTRALMHPAHYNRHGIRMMCVCPGMTNTNFITETDRDKIGIMYDIVIAALKGKSEQDTLLRPERVADLLIRMLRDDVEMAGAAAVLNSHTPEFFYQGEWKDIK